MFKKFDLLKKWQRQAESYVVLRDIMKIIPLNVLGTPSCLQAMYKQADAMASLLLPFKLFCS